MFTLTYLLFIYANLRSLTKAMQASFFFLQKTKFSQILNIWQRQGFLSFPLNIIFALQCTQVLGNNNTIYNSKLQYITLQCTIQCTKNSRAVSSSVYCSRAFYITVHKIQFTRVPCSSKLMVIVLPDRSCTHFVHCRI